MTRQWLFLAGLCALGTGDYGAGRGNAWWFIVAAAGALAAGIAYGKDHR